MDTERRVQRETVQREGVGRKKTVVECTGMVGGEQHGDSESQGRRCLV